MKRDWHGSALAWCALRRAADGLPLFPRPAVSLRQAQWRRRAVEWLYAEGLIERGARKGEPPQITDAGRDCLTIRPRVDAWTDRERRTVRALAGAVPLRDIAGRLGRTPAAVNSARQRYGLSAPAS